MDPIRQYLASLGRKGGKVGGKKRWADVSPEERSKQMKAIAAKRKKK